MIYFPDEKTTLEIGNRVSEYLLYMICRHLQKTGLPSSNKRICEDMFFQACDFADVEKLHHILPFLVKKMLYKFKIGNIETELFRFAKIDGFLNFLHFQKNFDIENYIKQKMNKIYWAYIDRNITSTIKYRKGKVQNYENKIQIVLDAIKNVSEVNTMSFLLFMRYKDALEPYFIVHSLLTNAVLKMRVKFFIGKTPRACTFGEKCRGGVVFISCHMLNATHEYSVDYCFCNKHLKTLKNENLTIDFCR